jgi:hypothetical protein
MYEDDRLTFEVPPVWTDCTARFSDPRAPTLGVTMTRERMRDATMPGHVDKHLATLRERIRGMRVVENRLRVLCGHAAAVVRVAWPNESRTTFAYFAPPDGDPELWVTVFAITTENIDPPGTTESILASIRFKSPAARAKAPFATPPSRPRAPDAAPFAPLQIPIPGSSRGG